MKCTKWLGLVGGAAMALCLVTSPAQGVVVRGTGNAALAGNDLTDLGNNGLEGGTYNIGNIHTSVASTINYHPGNAFQFPGDNNYSTINGGVGLGGDDFSVRAQAFLRFNNAGTFSIGAGSDDGRIVNLSLVSGTYSGITSVGGQITPALTSATSFGFNDPTGNNTSGGVFTVGAGTVLSLDTFMFERGGGDSFEVSIKAGNDNTPGGPGDGWELLTNGSLAGSVNVSTTAAFADTNFTVRAYNVIPGGTSNDNDLNTTGETQALWNAIDNGQGLGIVVIPPSRFEASFFASSEAAFGGGENAFNVFDNLTGGGNEKWCCQSVSEATDGSGQFVGADFSQTLAAGDFTNIVVDRFTLTSSNDTPGRDPDVWALQGSNDGVNWEVIYEFVATGTTGGGVPGLWGTTRNQVLEFSVANGDFALPPGYDQFRLFVDSVAGSGVFALSEIELFGSINVIPEPTSAVLGLIGLAMLGKRRRRLA